MELALSSTFLKSPHFFPASLQAKTAGISKLLMIRLIPSFKLKTKYLYLPTYIPNEWICLKKILSPNNDKKSIFGLRAKFLKFTKKNLTFKRTSNQPSSQKIQRFLWSIMPMPTVPLGFVTALHCMRLVCTKVKSQFW